MVLVSEGGAPSAQWPKAPYSFSQGHNEAYEQWLAALPPGAQAAEREAVCERFHAEYSQFVNGVLHFQILESNPDDPQMVTPANWDDEGKAIAARYNHRVPATEHWSLPMAEAFAIYNPMKSMRYEHTEGRWLNISDAESARNEGIPRPIDRGTFKGGKPATDPE